MNYFTEDLMLCYHKSIIPLQMHCNLIIMLFSFYRLRVQVCLLSNLYAQTPLLPQGIYHVIQRSILEKKPNTKQQTLKEVHFTKKRIKISDREAPDK